MIKKAVRVFDFDGTLITRDSVKLCYILMCGRFWRLWYYWPYISKYFFQNETVEKQRRKQIAKWLRLKDLYQKLDEKRNCFWFDDLHSIIDSDYYNIIISASYKELISIFCKDIVNIDLILAVSVYSEDPRYDFGKKVEIFRKQFGELKIESAYGDTRSDYPLLIYAENGFLRKNKELIKYANIL